MRINSSGIKSGFREESRETGWCQPDSDNPFKNGKGFIRCLCPMCSNHHDVYMLWTGRGVPRKYCMNCRPMVSGYNEGLIYDAPIAPHGRLRRHSKLAE